MAVTAGMLVVVLVGWVLVRRRGWRERRGWRSDPAAAERALRAEAERMEVQRRMTRMHPDFVRDWMRPR